MKKFFIVYKDGSQQTLMPAIHDTRKKAEEVLMDYIHHHNKKSGCFLSVFDFAIEEEDTGVSSFEEAKQVVGSSNFVPDFANHEQAKWFPSFKYSNGGIRFDSAFVVYVTGMVSDSVLRPGNVRNNSGDNLLIFTTKCFCYEIQDN